jgi:hypothetical protein
LVIDGFKPTHPSTVETTLVTMFSGANGPLNGARSACGATIAVGVAAARATGDDPAAGLVEVKVRRAGLDVVFVNRRVFGDCSVEPVLLGFACGIGDFDECDVTLRTGVLGNGGAVGVSAAELVPTEAVSDAFELGEGLDGLLVFVDEEAAEPDEPEADELDDELESDGSASATPGVVATAVPTPSATANAPIRPT